ncbi:hypothetical protein [Blautia producta]|uniref:hypothetical protein n=1 Tax=Blautia producta TaxID=33035 RepID=UPI0021088FA3|nr:hypothetical protein [Blautia producta]MCQ4744483.1 hypothetical protein [Blautia producta]
MCTTKQYQARTKRIDDALAVKEPDRVPVIPFVQTYSTPWRRPCTIPQSCRTPSVSI